MCLFHFGSGSCVSLFDPASVPGRQWLSVPVSGTVEVHEVRGRARAVDVCTLFHPIVGVGRV